MNHHLNYNDLLVLLLINGMRHLDYYKFFFRVVCTVAYMIFKCFNRYYKDVFLFLYQTRSFDIFVVVNGVFCFLFKFFFSIVRCFMWLSILPSGANSIFRLKPKAYLLSIHHLIVMNHRIFLFFLRKYLKWEFFTRKIFFFIAIVLSFGVGNCESANLTAITWRHEVNSHNALQEALSSKFPLSQPQYCRCSS